MNAKILIHHFPGPAAIEHCPERNEAHDPERTRQADGDAQNLPPWTFFFDLICLIQASDHSPSPIQGAPGGTQPRSHGSSADNGSGIQFNSGFRYKSRSFPRQDLLKGAQKHVSQIGSRAGERIEQNKQQQKDGKQAEEIVERQPGCLSKDFVIPALAACAFRQLSPGEPFQAPQISHRSTLNESARIRGAARASWHLINASQSWAAANRHRNPALSRNTAIGSSLPGESRIPTRFPG